MTTSGLLLYATAAICVAEALTSSLLTSALRNRFIRFQLLPPILPDESITKAMSTTLRHSLSDQKVENMQNLSAQIRSSKNYCCALMSWTRNGEIRVLPSCCVLEQGVWIATVLQCRHHLDSLVRETPPTNAGLASRTEINQNPSSTISNGRNGNRT